MRSLGEITITERAVLSRLCKGASEALTGNEVRLTLFGSRARGDGDPDADLDVYLEVDTECLSATERRRLKDLAGALSLETGFVICLLIADRATIRERGDYSIFENIREEGIAL